MSPRRYMAAVMIVLGLLLCGCGASDTARPVFWGEEFLAHTATLVVPDSIDAGGMIDVSISGDAGVGCDRLLRIESELGGRTWTLRPIGQRGSAPPGYACHGAVVHFETTVALSPVLPGWTYIEVESVPSTLLDSCYVRE